MCTRKTHIMCYIKFKKPWIYETHSAHTNTTRYAHKLRMLWGWFPNTKCMPHRCTAVCIALCTHTCMHMRIVMNHKAFEQCYKKHHACKSCGSCSSSCVNDRSATASQCSSNDLHTEVGRGEERPPGRRGSTPAQHICRLAHGQTDANHHTSNCKHMSGV